MACSGCGGRANARTGCFCAYCNPDDEATYSVSTRSTWSVDVSGFTDGDEGQFSVFNDTWQLTYTPQSANNCVWRADTPFVAIRLVGDNLGSEWKLYFNHRVSDVEIQYDVVGTFECGLPNDFSYTGPPNPANIPQSLTVTPGTLFTDCCFKTPLAALPDTLYATVQNINGSACIAGTYQLDRDIYGFDALRYRYWSGNDSIELVCGGDEGGRYWNIIASLSGCRVDRADCTGVIRGEGANSTYDPFVLSFSMLKVYPYYYDESCCAGTDSCEDSSSIVSIVITQ